MCVSNGAYQLRYRNVTVVRGSRRSLGADPFPLSTLKRHPLSELGALNHDSCWCSAASDAVPASHAVRSGDGTA